MTNNIHAVGASTLAALTDRERRIAELVSDGLTNNEVGAQLMLSPRTVEAHLGHIYRKYGLRSRTQLARLVLTNDGR